MKTTKLIPQNGNVVLDWESEKAGEETSFGLIIAGVKIRDDFATVIAVAKDSDLLVGDRVLFNKLAGIFYKDGLNEFLIITEAEVFAVVD